MIMHRISSYKDGFVSVKFCLNCGLEDDELSHNQCVAIETTCISCGKKYFSKDICPSCELIRSNFKDAIDRMKNNN